MSTILHSSWRGRKPALRRGALVATLFAMAMASLLPVGSAQADYDSATETSHTATVSEAYELSGLVASPRYPDWYWTHSDTWGRTDVVSACTGLSGPALDECRQVQRARLWALKLDPVTHAVTESRAFALSNPAWALDPFVAQNNDWEDIAVGPPRDGSEVGDLVIAATGDAAANRVLDAGGRDITCDTRRLIELPEPDLSDPTVTTWQPRKIFDLRSWVGTGGLSSCNVETLVVSPGEAGGPTAYLVSKTMRKVLSRSLVEATGRDPETPRAAPDSTLEHRPSVTYVGALRDSAGLKITAADSSETHVSMIVPRTAKHPCQVLTWAYGSSGVGTALTGTSPVRSPVTCNPNAEGLAYTRLAADPSTVTKDLVLVADTQSNTKSSFFYWFLPDG